MRISDWSSDVCSSDLRRQNRWVHAFAGMTGGGAELVIGQQRIALVVQRVAVGLHVVEPDMVGAAGVGLREQQDGGGYARVGAEHARGGTEERSVGTEGVSSGHARGAQIH